MPLEPSLTDYARGRYWQWRLPLLLFLTWDVLGQSRDGLESPSLFSGITFGAHELGHLFFAVGGEFLAIAGGSLMQLLVPIGAALLLYRHRDYFGIAVTGLWLASSLFDMATYIADARAFELDLLGFGEGGGHDWAWLLGRFHALPHDLRIAAAVRGAGMILLIASLAGGAWLCMKMRTTPRQVPEA